MQFKTSIRTLSFVLVASASAAALAQGLGVGVDAQLGANAGAQPAATGAVAHGAGGLTVGETVKGATGAAATVGGSADAALEGATNRVRPAARTGAAAGASAEGEQPRQRPQHSVGARGAADGSARATVGGAR